LFLQGPAARAGAGEIQNSSHNPASGLDGRERQTAEQGKELAMAIRSDSTARRSAGARYLESVGPRGIPFLRWREFLGALLSPEIGADA
jgi:hypothetical protein